MQAIGFFIDVTPEDSLMALDAVAAVGQVRPIFAGGAVDDGMAQLMVGELLHISIDDTSGAINAQTAGGQLVQLAGLGQLTESLMPGDVVQLRIVETAPQLKLALENAEAPPTAASPDGDQAAAMQVDQAVLSKQIIWKMPDAAMLASSWRLSYMQGRRALDETAPASLLHADLAALSLPEARLLRPPADMESWLLAAYTWGGQKLALRAVDPEEEQATKKKAGPGRLALRLEMVLPGWGKIGVQVEVRANTVLLDLAAEQANAADAMRKALPAMAQALARNGLRIARCRLAPTLAQAGPQTILPELGTVSPKLFMAMAEMTVLLMQWKL